MLVFAWPICQPWRWRWHSSVRLWNAISVFFISFGNVHPCHLVRHINRHSCFSEEFVRHITTCKAYSTGFMNLVWFFVNLLSPSRWFIPRNRLWSLRSTRTSIHHLLIIIPFCAMQSDLLLTASLNKPQTKTNQPFEACGQSNYFLKIRVLPPRQYTDGPVNAVYRSNCSPFW
jgi:hypothetical protein